MKYTIHGRKFASEPTYYTWDTERRYPDFAIIEEVEFETEAESLDGAFEWMLTNHPDYAIGCGISNSKGDFSCHAVKGYYSFLPNFDQKTIVDHELACLKERRR